MTTLAPKSILKKSGAAPAAVKKSLSFNDNVAVIGESTNIALLPPAPMKEPEAKSGSYRMGTMRIKGPAVLNGAKPAINDLYGGGGATSTELKEQQQKSVPYGATKQAKIAEPDPIVREGTILEGGLKVLKETGMKGTWVKRHVVLTRTELSYYKDAFTVQPIKTYAIGSDCYVKEISKRQGVLDCSNSLEIFFPKNGVVLKGASQREATEWITAICSVIDSLGGNSGSDDDMIFVEEGVDDFDDFVETTPEPPKSLYSFSAAPATGPTPVAATVSSPITPAPAPVVPVAAAPAPVVPVAAAPAPALAPAPVVPVAAAPAPVVPVAAAPATVTPVAVTPVAPSTAKTQQATIVVTPASSGSKTTPAAAPASHDDDDDEFEWYDEDEEPVKTTFHAVTHSPAPKHHQPAVTVSATKSAPSSLGTNVTTSHSLHPATPAPAPAATAPTPVATPAPTSTPTPAATTAPTRSGTVSATKTQPRATGFYTGVPRTNTVSTPANRTTASGPGRTASTGTSQPAPAPATTTPAKTPAATATKSTPYGGRPPVTSTIAPSGVNTGKVSGLLKMWEQNK